MSLCYYCEIKRVLELLNSFLTLKEVIVFHFIHMKVWNNVIQTQQTDSVRLS